MQILKESLDSFLSATIDRKGMPGEEILAGLLDSSGYAEINDSVISALRTLCKKSSVNNVLTSHGINLVRGQQTKVTYWTGETFQLHDFSGVDQAPLGYQAPLIKLFGVRSNKSIYDKLK